MWKKVVYIAAWSVGLLFATFPAVFKCTQNFDWSQSNMGDAGEKFYFPYIMVMELFLFDAIYTLLSDKSKRHIGVVVKVMVLLSIFLLTYALTMFLGSDIASGICFFIGWLSLTFMKGYTTADCLEISDTIKGSDENIIQY